jgi:hypothetical protein
LVADVVFGRGKEAEAGLVVLEGGVSNEKEETGFAIMDGGFARGE